MTAQKVFSYIYVYMEDRGLFQDPSWTARVIKTQKVMYFTELIHRIIFNTPLISDNSFSALENGPAINRQNLNYANRRIDASTLETEEKELLELCLKDFIVKSDVDELVDWSHGNNNDFKLVAWSKALPYRNIQENDIEEDVKIFAQFLKQKINKEKSC